MNKKIQEIFEHVVTLERSEREAYLSSACGNDAALRREVETLLRAHDDAAKFMASPTAGSLADSTPTADSLVSAQPLVATLQEVPGTRIGLYKLLQLIGEGGFGSVFMAEQEKPVSRKVALKIIKLGMDTRQVVARFEQERQALAMMDHPNIAKVLDAGATETGRPFFVMELVKGDPIVEYCDKHNLSIEDRLELFAQVCQAVQHAHTKGIIHRDIKPSNILVSTQDGRPHTKVIDFGIAKATASKLTEKTLFTEHRQLIGTPEYMSPEQAEGNLDIDTRTDVYSLGVLLYELLTGTTPFTGKELRSAAFGELQRIIRKVEPPKPSTRLSNNTDTIASVAAKRKTEPKRLGTIVRGELDWIVMKALEKDRQRRYETPSGLAMDIRRYLSGEAVVAAPPSSAYRFKKFIGRNKGPVIAGSAVAAALLVGVVAFAWQAKVANQQRDLAVTAQKAERERAQGEERAKQQAQRRLSQIEKANEILSSVFKQLDPEEIAQSGRPLQAVLVEHLDNAANELEGDAVGDPLVVAGLQIDLARSLEGLGEPSKAVLLLEKARATYAAKLGTDHTETLTSMNDLAMACFAAGEKTKARAMMKETLAARKSGPGANPRELVTCMNNLALIEEKSGNGTEAVTILKEALTLRTSLDGPEHPETANAMHNLALAYQETGDAELALPLVKEAVRIRKATIGENHPYTLRSVSLLAACNSALGEIDSSIELLTDALSRSKATLGAEHPNTINLATSLSRIYYQTGRMDNLQTLLEETLPAMKIRLGADHPDTLNAMANLAGVYWRNRQLEKSVPLYEEAFKAYERTLGRSDPNTLAAMANLGINYPTATRFEEATPLLEEVHRSLKDNASLQFAIPSLLDCYASSGKAEQADAIVDDVLAYFRKATPADSPTRAGAWAKVAEQLLRLDRFARAEPLLREALTIRERDQPDAWTTFNTKSMLGAALLGINKATEAEPLLLDGYQGLIDRETNIPPQGKVRIAESLARIVKLYENKGNQSEAAAWRTKLEAANSAKR